MTTWDPSAKDAAVSLSNGNLTATLGSGNNKGVLGTTTKAVGQWVFAAVITNTSYSAGQQAIGVGWGIPGVANTGSYVGDTGSVGFYANGDGILGNPNGPDWADGQTVYFAIKIASNGDLTIWCKIAGRNWNESGSANPDTNTGGYFAAVGTVYNFAPMVSLGQAGESVTIDPTASGHGLTTFTPWDAGSIGAAAGTGAAAGVGGATKGTTAAASGAGAGAAVGRAIRAAAGSAAGAGAASGVGVTIKAGVGSAAGVGAASGDGATASAGTTDGVGDASGAGAAAGVTQSIRAAVGSAAGSGSASGVGGSVRSAAGASSGAGLAAAITNAIRAAAGSAAGVGAAAGVGSTGSGLQDAVGTAAGAGAAAAVTQAIRAAVGAASGAGAASGVAYTPATIISAVGSAAGAGVAQAIASIKPKPGTYPEAIEGGATVVTVGRTGGGSVMAGSIPSTGRVIADFLKGRP